MATPPLPDAVLQETVNALAEHGGNASLAARELGIDRGTFRARLETAARRGINSTVEKIETLHGWNPAHDLTKVIPDPLVIRGTSSLYKDGVLKLQWVKTKLSEQRLNELIQTVIATLGKGIEGLSPLVDKPKLKDKDLLCAYVLGDPHFGLYCWGDETGDAFDVKLAADITTKAIDRLVASAPPAQNAILLSVGDTLHGDDQTNATPRSGYQLDCDTRFAKVLDITIQSFRHCILRLLEKHQNVTVRFVKGNHDPHSHLTLAFALRGYFSNNKRVLIDISPADFWYYKFGKNLIGSTHGDKTKPANLLGVMVADRPVEVGQTEHRVFYTGHIHHQTVHEFAGLTVESFQTLAPKDAHAASHAYRAQRSMVCIVHHAEHGEIDRHRCGISMIG